jgi:hypothetical protein
MSLTSRSTSPGLQALLAHKIGVIGDLQLPKTYAMTGWLGQVSVYAFRVTC